MAATDDEVGVSAWIELLHAEVCWELDQVGVRPLVIKGPSIAEWLYPGEERVSTDADILVHLDEWQRAVQVLHERGFVDHAEGVRDVEQVPHGQTFTRTDPALGGHFVDLHRYFPGIGADRARAFETLWSRRTEARQAGITVAIPDRPSSLLIVVLHAARGALTDKVLEDLRRAWMAEGASLFVEAKDLAVELDALPAFRVGLESIEETRPLVNELGLQDVDVPPLWRLQSELAPGTAIHLEEALELPWPQRPAFVMRWLFPSPATMRIREPGLQPGGKALAAAYSRRLVAGLRSAPQAVRLVRRSRHR